MGFRMVVLDLDGTVVRADGTVSRRTREAVRAVRDAGLLVVVATGRRLRAALPVLRDLELNGPGVFCNGALAVDLTTWRTLWAQPLGRKGELVSNLLLDAGLAPALCYHALTGPDVWVAPGTADLPRWLQDGQEAGAVGYADNLPALAHGAVKLVAAGPLPQVQAAVRGASLIARTMVSAGAGGAVVEVWHPAFHKGMAIRELAERAGIPRHQVMAFGDNHNDVELLAWAGLGIAMGNAVPEAQAAARAVCPPCEADGVAQALADLVLSCRVAV